MRAGTNTGEEGHGLTFTLGRGTDIVVSALRYLARVVEGRSLEDITADLNGFYVRLTGDTQLRWLGPEKGVISAGLRRRAECSVEFLRPSGGQAGMAAVNGQDAGVDRPGE